MTTSFRNSIIIGLFLQLVLSVEGEAPSVNLSQAAWLKAVEVQRCGQRDFSVLANYDPKLLREYFRQYPALDEAPDLLWKVKGLTLFGDPSDQAILEKSVQRLKTASSHDNIDMGLFDHAIMARHGDKKATEAVVAVASNCGHTLQRFACQILWRYRDRTGLDKLSELASDRRLPATCRLNILEWLCAAGDQRCLEIALSDNLISALNQDGQLQSIGVFLAHFTGQIELRSLSSPQEIREYVRNTGCIIGSVAKRYSVSGGIDWTKVKWDELRSK